MSNIVVALSPLPQPTGCLQSKKSLRPSRPQLRSHALTLTRSLLTCPSFLSQDQAQEVDIKHARSGQPYLWSQNCHSLPLPHISVSHSQSWVGVLLSSVSLPCALDIEDMNHPRSYKKIAHWAFSKKEAHFVEKEGKLAFYALWTAKEAWAKSQGLGLTTALKTTWDDYLDKFGALESFEVSVNDEIYTFNQQILDNHLFHTTIQKAKNLQTPLIPLVKRFS